MAVPVEAFTVVLRDDAIGRHLAEGSSQLAAMVPNDTLVSDGEITRVSFMAQTDADAFFALLETHGFRNGVDLALVDAGQVESHDHEWLVLAPFDEATIVALRGTKLDKLFAREGWSPTTPSTLEWLDADEMAQFDLVEESDGVSTWRHRVTNELRYSARPRFPHMALFDQAAELAGSLIQMDGPPLPPITNEDERAIREAIRLLIESVELAPQYWRAWWLLGKFHQRVGDEGAALAALRKAAHSCGSEDVNTWREYAGACARVGAADEGLSAAEMAVEIDPEDAGLVSNLALAHLLAGNTSQAQQVIQQADSMEPGHPVTQELSSRIDAVARGDRPQPTTMADIMANVPAPKRRWGRLRR